MSPSGGVFRIEVTSKNTLYTKEIVEEITQRLSESDFISRFLIEELYEKIKLFEKKKEAS